MAQDSVAPETSHGTQTDEHTHEKSNMLGPILCWAVVFADIGTSIYYVPGILYQTPGIEGLAGFFVLLTMSVFILLTLKYAEVTHRFPQGGGVVTVAAQALNPWFGALGGMFILVDYFLTAAISCLSGILYFSVVIPAISPFALWITVCILILLGVLNWVGISESARVSLVGAVIAFLSDLAILYTVFTHLSIGAFLALIPEMFASHALTPLTFLMGFAGSFLAFSGLESISQLSPVMKQPHKKVAGIALLLVVLTIGLTSPMLTILSTLLLTPEARDPVLSTQLISLLAGHWGNIFLQIEVAISASALLVFASNTAIIGAYHVFIALSRMEFLPAFILRRNKLRNSPHFSIALATGIPIIILIAVRGNINILGDMYAFGLLGAFTLTCLGLDIVRARDWRRVRKMASMTEATAWRGTIGQVIPAQESLNGQVHSADQTKIVTAHDLQISNSSAPASAESEVAGSPHTTASEVKGLWFKIDFFLGILTTFLVATAWSTNLVSKPLATAFGGSVALVGMGVAYVNNRRSSTAGRVPVSVVATRIEEALPNSVLAILLPDSKKNEAVVRAAVNNADERHRPIMFVYIGKAGMRTTAPRMLEIVDPYLEDLGAKQSFARAEGLVVKSHVPKRTYVYLQGDPDIANLIWQQVHPRDTVVAADNSERFKDINPDRVRYEITPEGKVAHLLKQW
ncbi:MAG TPA: APC family permease [Ktedonobacteraceae bacterium]|nr:APC family permease [Ktedonobacteraceae bacterium]